MDMHFQTNAQAYLAFEAGSETEKRIIEWSGPIPSKTHFIRFIDGDEVIPLLVTAVEWIVTMSGDYSDGLVAPAEIYIHAKQWDHKSTLRESDVEPEIVSADTHPVLITNNIIVDPESNHEED